MVVSLNLPVRQTEDKRRRRDGKSQGGPKPKAKPTLVSVPSKSPTKVPPTPPVLAPPSVLSIPSLLQAAHVKDATAMSPNLPYREGKATRRKERVVEKEKEQPKTATIRKKKQSATQTVSIEHRTSSENDAPKNSKTSSESHKNDSDGSKEPSDNADDKNKPKFNSDLAKNFFKHMIESKKARKRTEDARVDTMPESSQLNKSARALRNSSHKKPEPAPDFEIFKPNGEPVWVVDELAPGECVNNEDGVVVKNPELAKAMAADNLVLEEIDLIDMVEKYLKCTMPRGTLIPENYNFDALAPIDILESNSEYVSPETVTYNTFKNLVDLSEGAIKRFSMKRDGMDDRSKLSQDKAIETTATSTMTVLPNLKASETSQLKTCEFGVTFNLKHVICLSYDRKHPIASIRKFRKKMDNTTTTSSTEKTTNSKDY
eukprot:NP_496775.2 Uncharacterized protein CELE_F42G4.2 [Caenorhabditis elegans]